MKSNNILFVINNLEIGGIQKSLVELLNVISADYNITLYCISLNGFYKNLIPSNIRVIEGNKIAKISEYDYRRATREFGAFWGIVRILLSFISKRFGRKYPAMIITKTMGVIQGKYDFAFSYAHPQCYKSFHNLCCEIVLNNVIATKKYSFIHCDYSNYGGDCQYNRYLLKQYDGIVGVSNSVVKRFVETVNYDKEKSFVIYNACDVKKIQELANKAPIYYKEKTIVSVSRLTKEKGLLRFAKQVKKYHENGQAIHWVIVGDGPCEDELNRFIATFKLDGIIELVGSQTNPFRYMKNAAFLALPSIHEAAPMVFHEAASLGVPILTTETLSAKELVENRGWGYVCPNDEDGIYKIIETALKGFDIKNVTVFDVNSINELVKKQFDTILDS